MLCEAMGQKPGHYESPEWKEFINKSISEILLKSEDVDCSKTTKSKSVNTDTPKVKRARTVDNNQLGKSSKKDDSTSTDKTLLPTSASIERLKSYIVKCGMRKIWKRELADLTEREALRKLQAILHDELGMEGKPSLEKCRKIREQRDFQAEIDAIRESNGQPIANDDDNSGGRSKRRVGAAPKILPQAHLDLSKYGDEE